MAKFKSVSEEPFGLLPDVTAVELYTLTDAAG